MPGTPQITHLIQCGGVHLILSSQGVEVEGGVVCISGKDSRNIQTIN